MVRKSRPSPAGVYGLAIRSLTVFRFFVLVLLTLSQFHA
jgi:hypothetical protein